jgi:hypothetical protein
VIGLSRCPLAWYVVCGWMRGGEGGGGGGVGGDGNWLLLSLANLLPHQTYTNLLECRKSILMILPDVILLVCFVQYNRPTPTPAPPFPLATKSNKPNLINLPKSAAAVRRTAGVWLFCPNFARNLFFAINAGPGGHATWYACGWWWWWWLWWWCWW